MKKINILKNLFYLQRRWDKILKLFVSDVRLVYLLLIAHRLLFQSGKPPHLSVGGGLVSVALPQGDMAEVAAVPWNLSFLFMGSAGPCLITSFVLDFFSYLFTLSILWMVSQCESGVSCFSAIRRNPAPGHYSLRVQMLWQGVYEKKRARPF